MFERYTERARQVVVLAQMEARELRHAYIGTEHILLGLIREREGIAARTLSELGLTLDEVRAQLARVVGQGDEATTGQINFTPRAKNVLEYAARESLGHEHVGTEHLLLALVRENQGLAARILWDFGLWPDEVRDRVVRALGGTPTAPDDERVAEVRRLKDEALAAKQFARAAHFRRRERELLGVGPPPPPERPPRAVPVPAAATAELVARRTYDWMRVAAAALWALVGLAVGVLLGRAIWG